MHQQPFNEVPNQPSILHIIAINGIGGAEKLLVTFLPALKVFNPNIKCLLFYREKSKQSAYFLGEELSNSGINVFYQPYTDVFQQGNLTFLEGFLNESRPDVIHAHLKHAEIWVALLKWRKKIKVPVVATLHGYRDQYHNVYGLTWNRQAKFSPYYWLSKFTSSQIDKFISISKGIASFFQQSKLVKSEKIVTVYHGTTTHDISAFNNQVPQPNFVLIGRLVNFKGHKYALEATKILKSRFPSLQLHFYGTGPNEKQLRNLAVNLGVEQNTFFHGFVQNLNEKLTAHSIALIPSIGEPFGLVFFDAFKANLPVVAFDLPASNEIIQHGKNGLLAEPLNAASLAEQMEKLLLNQDLFQAIKINAAEVLKAHFTIEKMAKEYSAFYQGVVLEYSAGQN